ncbi:MAG TPA: alpha/beta hydrolase [Streptosporangiaceae bacterium]|nr:alpha/beta hydrolase [Streptosporangiaceae bacterium]
MTSSLARIKSAVLRGTFALPHPVRRFIAGRPIRKDDQEMALEAQLLLRFMRLDGKDELWAGSVAASRASLEEAARMMDVHPAQPVATSDLTIPGPAADIPARLYTPDSLPPGSPLLVFYHGGGWVIGSLDTHDNLCRFLALNGRVRVLSVDYRLAPEHPFPAGVDDAFAAFDYAVRSARSLDADPNAVAVGGDSAGANLAAVVSAAADRHPAFALLLYPRVDFTARRRSQELFAQGFLLTEKSMDRMESLYLQPAQKTDRNASVLLTADLSAFPPTYLCTAGFDPLRDEGEEFAAKLAAAGVPVVYRRHGDLIHGYASLWPAGGRFAEAAAEAAAALHAGLHTAESLRSRKG